MDRRNPEMTKDLRFDLAGALIALAIIRLESTRQVGGYSLEGTSCRGMYFETENTHFQVAIDLFFFVSFLGAKLVGRTGSRELCVRTRTRQTSHVTRHTSQHTSHVTRTRHTHMHTRTHAPS